MEGIINLEDIFEQEPLPEDDVTQDYSFKNVTLRLKTRKLHIGVSRSVWKASIVMSNYLYSAINDDKSHLNHS